MNGYLFPELAPPPPPLPSPLERERAVEGWPTDPPSLHLTPLLRQIRLAREADKALDKLGKALANRDPDSTPADCVVALVKGVERSRRWNALLRDFVAVWLAELKPIAEPLIAIRNEGLWRSKAGTFVQYVRNQWPHDSGNLLSSIEAYEFFASMEGQQ